MHSIISQRDGEEDVTNDDGHFALNNSIRMSIDLLPLIQQLDIRSESIQKKISERKSTSGPTYAQLIDALYWEHDSRIN